MAFQSLKDLYVDELKDLYDAERQIISAMPKMIKASSSPDVRRAFEHHLDQTKMQVERLDLIFKNLGISPQGRRCLGIEGILAEADEFIQKGGAPDVADAALIAAAQRVEHYEIASYGSARTFAQRLEDRYAAGLLQATLDEEGDTDKILTGLAEGGINESAAEGKEIRGSRLRYVNVNDWTPGDRTKFADVQMLSPDGDNLGTLDGFVVDRETGRPYYLVVDAVGWFTGGRYVLPVGKARFDADKRWMRVDVDKDTVKKYPEFDEGWFGFGDERRREYEGRVLGAFVTQPTPGVAGGFDYAYETMPEFREPEWWRTDEFRGTSPRKAPGREHRPERERLAARERPEPDRPDREGGPLSEGRSTIDEPSRNEPGKRGRRG